MNQIDTSRRHSRRDLRLKGADITIVSGVHEGNTYVFDGSTLILRGIVKGNIYLENNSSAFIHGIVTVNGVHEGNIYVFDGSTLILRGIVNGNVYLEDNSSAFIHGIVTGNVTNNGGRLRHYGVIKGQLNRLAGETVIWPKSIIGEITH